METHETRIRMGAKQTAKGAVQLDLTTEATTVDEAGKLMEQAIPRLKEVVAKNGLQTVDQSG